MLWKNSSDTFAYKVNISANRNFTIRGVLSKIARIYYPLWSLWTSDCQSKKIYEKQWLIKLEWNENLPLHVSRQWENFIATLPELESIKVQRCFLKVNLKSVVMNGFADASSKAYSAVIYFQTVSSTNERTSQLLCQKSHVVPTKVKAIPRLELSACFHLQS